MSRIVDFLTELGLTRQEATIYTTLCTEGEVTGYEVAKLTGISRSNAYTSLAGLVEKGAAYVIEGDATTYCSVDPEDFCTNKLRRIERIKAGLVREMPKTCREIEGYITIKGRLHIVNKMKNMIDQGKERE